jgi:pseudaminic acid synthase
MQPSIGPKFPPFIVAELSGNHAGSIEVAKRALFGAKQAGVSAVKLQTYTPDTMTLNVNRSEYVVSEGLWAGRHLYDLYKEAHTPFEWHRELFEYASSIDLLLFSTPFDETAVDLLEDLGCPLYKVASFELQDTHLIKYIASTGKVLIISTGMSDSEDIKRALDVAQTWGSEKQIVLHCTSSYPTEFKDVNLKQIAKLREDFGVDVGLSDHTKGTSASAGAIALGAVLIEKHFKESFDTVGPDSSFSLSVPELKSLVEVTNEVWLSLGFSGYTRPDSESKSLIFRRSLVFAQDLVSGTQVTLRHVVRRRPGFGLAPYLLDEVVGKTLTRDVTRGEAVSFDHLK